MAFRTRPRKESRRSRLVMYEIGLLVATILVFGKEIWFLILWLFSGFKSPGTPTGLELKDAYQTLLLVLFSMVVGMILLIIFLARRGAYPIRNADEIAAELPRDESYSLNNPQNSPQPQVKGQFRPFLPPVPPALSFNSPYLRSTMWDWIFPPTNDSNPVNNSPSDKSNPPQSVNDDEYRLQYGQTLEANFSQRFRDTWFAWWHQFRWFLGARGLNAVIQKGKVISSETGGNYRGARGFVISDFDGTYLLDATQNGQRTGMPPQAGWFGIHRTQRTKILESTNLQRISRAEKGISAYTSDGIEILADISAVFSLGMRPINVDVSFQKHPTPQEQIFSIKLQSNDEEEYTFTRDDGRELDEQDRVYIQSRLASLMASYEEESYQRGPNSFDFEFEPERIVRALTSKPITKEGKSLEWRDILLQYTKDVFKRIMMNYSFDDLYGNINDYDSNRYPIDDILDEVQWEVQREGMLTYRLFWAKNDTNNIPIVEDKLHPDTPSVTYPENQIGNAPTVSNQSPFAYRVFSNAEPLPDNPQVADEFQSVQKFLRSRGIRVVSAEFENIRPKNPEIDDTKAYVWASQLTKEADILRGRIEKDHTRIMNEAIADTQEQVIDQLLDVLNSGAPEEVALLEFLNSLEAIVNRDDMGSIIPRDFTNLLGELRQWMK